ALVDVGAGGLGVRLVAGGLVLLHRVGAEGDGGDERDAGQAEGAEGHGAVGEGLGGRLVGLLGRFGLGRLGGLGGRLWLFLEWFRWFGSDLGLLLGLRLALRLDRGGGGRGAWRVGAALL